LIGVYGVGLESAMGNVLSGPLRRTARAAESRPGFLAAAFARYRAVERIDEAELAHRLRIGGERLPELSLCLRPRPDRFRQDVAAIALRFGADVGALASLIRQVDAFDEIEEEDPRSLLAAARDVPEDAP
jgi:hypothetical protein